MTPAAAGRPAGVTPGRDAGFTLIEVVVALALFALIAAAGAALVGAVLDVQRRTDGRLERLTDLDRTLTVVARDLDAVVDAPLVGGRDGVAFDRHDARGTATGVRYRLTGTRFERVAAGQPQRLLDRVAAARWSYAGPAGWQDHWPDGAAQARAWPSAVALELDLTAPARSVRRVVDLPVRPLPPGVVAP